jgi:hypothetical protein
METVQLIINDAAYAAALRDLLERNGTRDVRCVETPDPAEAGVIVVDSDALDRWPLPLAGPERVVLVTRNDPQHLAQAWNAGIRSVVFNEDPLSTAVLAIMAAELRVPRGEARPVTQGHGPAGFGTPAGATRPRERRG